VTHGEYRWRNPGDRPADDPARGRCGVSRLV